MASEEDDWDDSWDDSDDDLFDIDLDPEDSDIGLKPSDFQLHVNDQKAGDATIAVGWCLSKELAEKLVKEVRSYNNPHVLITVVNDGKEIGRRMLCPLTQSMTYVPFNKSGLNQIHAFLVHTGSSKGIGGCLYHFRSRSGYDYSFSLFDAAGECPDRQLRELVMEDPRILAHAEVAVEVDEQLFAKKPWGWLWRWGNHLFRREPSDQCDFRKRLILAFTIQPIVVGLWCLLKGVGWLLWLTLICPIVLALLGTLKLSGLATACLLGLRQINWRTFVPDRSTWDVKTWAKEKDLVDVVTETFMGPIGNRPNWLSPKHSFFLYTKEGVRRPVIWLAIYPPFILWLCVLAWTIKPTALEQSHGVGNVIVLSFGTLMLLILGYVLFDTIQPKPQGSGKSRQPNWLEQLLKKMQTKALAERQKEVDEFERKEQIKAEEAQRALEAKFSSVVCTGTPQPVSYEAVPPQNRTFRLKWDKVKRRVCRPFSQ